MFEKKEEIIELIKQQIGSNGETGWPVAVRDRIAFPRSSELIVSDANVAVTFLWTMRDSVLPNLEKENLAIATNFYTPAGLQGMVRNILGNPFIRYIILLGEEYSSKSEGDKISELTSANAIRAFFESGVNEDRKIEGFESAVYFDKNIPLELIEKIRQNVKLIDLNKTMPYASLSDKIHEANRLIRTLEKQEPFLEKPETFEYESMDESFPYEGGPLIVHGSNIPNAWIKMISNIYRYGRKNLMNANTDRWIKEINNMAVVIHNPQDMDLSVNPFLVPLTIEKIEAYKSEILSSILPEGKAYTYGNELRAYHYPSAREVRDLVNSTEYKDFEFGQGSWIDENVNYVGESCEINQIKDIIDVLKRDPYSKACVAITWHPSKELMKKHKSSPCLVFLQAMVQDEKLNLTVFFRSHDMTQGWPENAYGCAAIQEEIAKGIGVESGIMTIISGSAQIYNNYYQQVEEMLKKYSEHLKNCHDKRGNYLIKVESGEIVVDLIHPETGVPLEKFSGKDSIELKDKIAMTTCLNTGHAIYIGKELAKAEIALKQNLNYEQEKELVFNCDKVLKNDSSIKILNEKNLGERPSWDEYFMKIAISASSRASCHKVQSGSVIVCDNKIIGTGYNGAPPGVVSCVERGHCYKEEVTGKSYEENIGKGNCIAAHSEMNALAHLNKLLHKDATLYTTIFPCLQCAKIIIAYKINRIVFKKKYDSEEMERALRLFAEAGIEVCQLDLSKERVVDIDTNSRASTFGIWS